ncbi:SH3 domain-containing protein [Bacillus sp. Brlt_9]|uniref:SH3 domain-containing protein n=1 Tax=Bacillus sp. Brlt_9 TaxID=3110916 RepID=UPI003F7C9563
MNKKLSVILLFLLFISLISVLLIFMAFSQGKGQEDVTKLKTGYEQLDKQVKELKVKTSELSNQVNGKNKSNNQEPSNPNPPSTQQPPAPAPKTVGASNLNMRSSASASAQVVRQLSKGEQVTPTGQTSTVGGAQWIEVKDSKGSIGWVVGTFLQ